MIRVVFDWVVLLQAAARPAGPAAACLQAVRDGRLELFLGPDILAEVRDVLSRPRTIRKFPSLTPEKVKIFLEDVASHATMIATVPKVFALPRDPKDELSRPRRGRDDGQARPRCFALPRG